MGCKEQAFDYTWMSVSKSVGLSFQKPLPYICDQEQPTSAFKNLNFVCVKYGTKYGADYVNKLYDGVRRNCSLKFDFICFTEDSEGLDKEIKV